MATSLPYNITVTDGSPTVQYLPYRDGIPSGGWNHTCTDSIDSQWSPESFCTGTSGHRTSAAGASLSLSFQGTAVYLSGSATSTTSESPAYIVTVDGESSSISNQVGMLFAATGLAYTVHNVTLTNDLTNPSSIIFNQAILTLGVPNGVTNKTVSAVELNGSGGYAENPFVTYNGQWKAENKLTSSVTYPRSDTQTAQNSMTFPLAQSGAFFIYGSAALDHSVFQTFLLSDNGSQISTNSFNGSSHWRNLDVVLYWESGLDPNKQYSVQVINQGTGSTPWFDFARIDFFQSSNSSNTSSPNQFSPSHTGLGTGAIIGIGVGGAILLLLTTLVAVACFLQKRRRSSANNSADLFQPDPAASVASPFLPSGYQTSEYQPDTSGDQSDYRKKFGSAILQSENDTFRHSQAMSSSMIASSSDYRSSSYVAPSRPGGKVIVEEDAGRVTETNAEFLPPGYREEWLGS